MKYLTLYMRSGNVIKLPIPNSAEAADISYYHDTDGVFRSLKFNLLKGGPVQHFAGDTTAIEAIVVDQLKD